MNKQAKIHESDRRVLMKNEHNYTGFCEKYSQKPVFSCCYMYNYNTEIMSIR